MNTKVFKSDYKGAPMFSIYEVDTESKKICKFNQNTGEALEAKPVVNMGIKKASLIDKHSEDLNAFILEQAES